MTVTSMIHSFLLKAKELDRTDVINMKTFDIAKILDQSQDDLIDTLFANKNYEALENLIDDSYITSGSFGAWLSGIDGAISIPLTAMSDYRNYIRSQSNITRSAVPPATAKNAANIDIDKSEIGPFESNTINSAIFYNPRCFVEGAYLIVIPDAYTTINAETVVYLKTPTALIESATSDLPDYLHETIVDMALIKSAEVVNVQDLKK